MEAQAHPANTDSSDSKPKKSEKHSRLAGFLWLAIILLIVISIVIANSGPKAKYQASVDTSSFVVVNPTTLSAGGTVKNIGKKAGKPMCTIDVSDASGNYSGQDMAQLNTTLQPGQSTRFQDQNITITKQGAQYVTQGTITCQ
jgi:hypothetical protein